MNSYKDKIEKLLGYIKRHKNTPDLHSFVADSVEGKVFVEFEHEVFCVVLDGSLYRGDIKYISEMLEKIEINLDTVEI